MLDKVKSIFNNKLAVRLLRENMRIQAYNYAIAMVAMIFIAVTSALTAWIMSDIIDSMMATGDRAKVFAVALAVAGIFAIKGIATYVQLVCLGKAGNSIVAYQQRKLYSRILAHGLSFFSEGDSSDLLMRVTVSAEGARQVIDTIVTGFVRDVLTLVGLIIVMYFQQPFLTLFCLIVGPIALLVVRKIVGHVRAIMESQMESMSEIIKIIQETSTGIRVVKAFALEGKMVERMRVAVENVEERSNSIKRLEAATSPLMETLAGLAIAGVVAISAFDFFGQSSSSSSAGELMSFITAVMMAYGPAKRLAKMRVSLSTGMRRVEMMYQVLDMPISVAEKPDSKLLPKGQGVVQFNDVEFEYGNGQSVLRGITIDFAAGKTTALVGPSGGGKSTIMNLMMRLYDPTKGTVKIDGFDVSDVTFASLRDQISFVGQDTFLFAGSVKSNIALGREGATEAQILNAAKAANAHEFILKMQNGYDTDVGENGSNLSGGQRQRISIARAILRDSPILLMDEATSALDSGSEFLIKESLDHLTEGRTTIVIAHRLSTVLNAHHIVVVNDGAIEEQGTLNELLENKGLFRSLYDQQYKTAAAT